jgi:hypothetical protein
MQCGTRLMDQTYTVEDAEKNRNVVRYAEDVIRYASSAFYDSELEQLLWVLGNLDPRLRRDLASPTCRTTTAMFMEVLELSQARWYLLYSKKRVHCR